MLFGAFSEHVYVGERLLKVVNLLRNDNLLRDRQSVVGGGVRRRGVRTGDGLDDDGGIDGYGF